LLQSISFAEQKKGRVRGGSALFVVNINMVVNSDEKVNVSAINVAFLKAQKPTV